MIKFLIGYLVMIFKHLMNYSSTKINCNVLVLNNVCNII